MREKKSGVKLADPKRDAGILGLFPAFETIGGVQASGRLAWHGITQAQDPAFGERYLISHGQNGHGAARSEPGRPLAVTSRLRAAAAALSRRWPVSVVLVPGMFKKLSGYCTKTPSNTPRML